MFGFHVIRQYEQGIVFDGASSERGYANPQEAITRDNVTPPSTPSCTTRWSTRSQPWSTSRTYNAVSRVAQTSLRSVTGHADMDQLLSGGEQVNAELKEAIDGPTEVTWGHGDHVVTHRTSRSQRRRPAGIDETEPPCSSTPACPSSSRPDRAPPALPTVGCRRS